MKREQIEAEFDKSYLTPHNEIPKDIKTLAIDFAQHIAKLEREACAVIVEPKDERPCDIIDCYCGYIDNAEAVTRWDENTANAKAIRAKGNK